MHLRSIAGGLGHPIALGTVRVVPLRLGDPLPDSALPVTEQDTYRLLAPSEIVADTEVHPIHLHTDLVDQQAHSIGEVLRRDHRLVVITYDVDAQPITRAAWIRTAYRNLLQHADREQKAALALPLLGCRYPVLDFRTSLNLLLESIATHQGQHPEQIYLRLDQEQLADVVEQLQSAARDRPG